MRPNPKILQKIRRKPVLNSSLPAGQARTVPVLRSRDLRRSSVFYRDHLGFAVFKEVDGLRVRSSNFDIKLIQGSDAGGVSNMNVVFRVGKIRKLHDEYRDRALPRLSNLKQSTCGKLKFSLLDPDGNSLHFVEENA